MGIGTDASGGTKGGCLSQSPFRVRYQSFSRPVLQIGVPLFTYHPYFLTKTTVLGMDGPLRHFCRYGERGTLLLQFIEPMPWRSPTAEDRQGDQLSFFAYGAYPVPQGLPCGTRDDVADLGPYNGQYVLLLSTAQDPVMAYAHEPLGQHVHGKAPDELGIRHPHQRFFSPVAIVLYRKGDRTLLQVLYAMVTYGDLMGIPAQVFDYLSRAMERSLAIHYPVLGEKPVV